MLKLTYSRVNDEFATVTVLGDAEGIRDLYWKLTTNCNKDSIGKVTVSDLDGYALSEKIIFTNPHGVKTRLSKNW